MPVESDGNTLKPSFPLPAITESPFVSSKRLLPACAAASASIKTGGAVDDSVDGAIGGGCCESDIVPCMVWQSEAPCLRLEELKSREESAAAQQAAHASRQCHGSHPTLALRP